MGIHTGQMPGTKAAVAGTGACETDSESQDRARYPRVILASVCLPWAPDGSLIEDVFRDQIRLHLAAGVGVMLYQMLAGRAPFGAPDSDLMAIVMMHLHNEPPPLREADPEIAPEIAPLFGVSRRTIGNRLTCFQRLTTERV